MAATVPTAASFTIISQGVWGNKNFAIVKFTGTAGYVTGGYVLGTTAQPYVWLGFGTTPDLILPIGGVASGTAAFNYNWDPTAKTLQVLYPQGGSAGGANNGDGLVKTGVATASAVNATQPDIDSAEAKEVASALSLASQIVYLLVIG